MGIGNWVSGRVFNAVHGNNLVITVPFVVFGVFRYLHLVHHRGEGGDPSRVLFRDPSLISSGVLWALAVYAALTLPEIFPDLT